MVDSTLKDLDKAIITINNELKQYDSKLSKLPYLLTINKIDLLDEKELAEIKIRFPEAVFISAEAKTNIEELRQAIVDMNP